MGAETALGYALIAAAATIIGGLLPLYTRIKHIELRYLIGFASGVMLSVAFFDMLPEIRPEARIDFFAIALGFFIIYAIEKVTMIHSCGEHECESHKVGWVSIIGIATESLVDGIAIAVGYLINPAVGIVIAAAVIVHELPRGFSTAVIMKAARYRKGKVLTALMIDAFFAPLGATVVLLNLFPLGFERSLLAFAAGTFLYIGASDLLPEAHKRFNIFVVASVIAGATVIGVLSFVIH